MEENYPRIESRLLLEKFILLQRAIKGGEIKIPIGYIYKTTNLINGKVYIGKHVGRFNSNYIGSGKHLKYSINKYGLIHFKIELVAYVTNKNELNKLEKYYISKARELLNSKNVYNITDGGKGFTGIHTQETKDKIVKSRIGKHHTQKTKDKISKSMSGENNYRYGASIKLFHKPNCQCYACKAARGEIKGENHPMYNKHWNQKIKDKMSKAKKNKSLKHKLGCLCCICKVIRGCSPIHKSNCQCGVCKAKRGEYKGMNHPMSKKNREIRILKNCFLKKEVRNEKIRFEH